MRKGRYSVPRLQSAKSSPNIWGLFAAAIGRVVSSVSSGDEFRYEIYVDDPLLARTFTIALLAIGVLGSPLAWDKASLGDREVWIGAQLSVCKHYTSNTAKSHVKWLR